MPFLVHLGFLCIVLGLLMFALAPRFARFNLFHNYAMLAMFLIILGAIFIGAGYKGTP